MCLYYSAENFRESETKRTSSPKVYEYHWKVYDVKLVNQSKIQLLTIFRNSKYNCPGVIMSDALDVKFNSWGGAIYHGIHVYTDKTTAKKALDPGEVIVKVKCYNKDLIMIGKGNEAVYDRIEVEQDEYRRLLRNLLRRKNAKR